MSLFDKIDITDHGIEQIDNIRDGFKNLLAGINHRCIEGREFSIAKTKLEEACFYAIKSCCIKNKK